MVEINNRIKAENREAHVERITALKRSPLLLVLVEYRLLLLLPENPTRKLIIPDVDTEITTHAIFKPFFRICASDSALRLCCINGAI